jgi:hypothetical protein
MIEDNDKRYVLQDREGDYVREVEKTEWETVKVHFKFTKELGGAKIFTYDEILSRLATNPIGVQFIQGFSGGRIVPL